MTGKFTLKWRVKGTDTWYKWTPLYDKQEIETILKNVSAANPTQEYKIMVVLMTKGGTPTYIDFGANGHVDR